MSGRGRPYCPVVTIQMMNSDLFALDRWHWELRWSEERPAEPLLDPASGQRPRPLRVDTWNGGWTRTRKGAERSARAAWEKTLREAADKPTIRYSL